MFLSTGVFVDALFLLFGDNSDRSKALVKEFIEVHDKLVAKKDILSGSEDLIAVYKSLIKTVISENISQQDETQCKILLLKLKNNETLKNYPSDRDILIDVLTAKEPITAKQIDEYTKRILNILLQSELDVTTRKIFAKNKVASEIMDVDDQEAALIEIRALLDNSLKAIETRQNNSGSKASESYVSFSDKESVLRAMNTYVERSVNGVIITGLQGLNKALGKRGGLGLGEMSVFAALSHNFKSGMLVCIMVWAIVYNKFVVPPGKKALVYFVSLENEVNQNIMDVFTILYGRLEKKKVDMATMTPEFITGWLVDYFAKFDIELIIDRYTPHDFSYGKFIRRFNDFENMGYHLVLKILDYMSEMRGTDPGDTISPQGRIQMIQENYLKFANHAKGCGYHHATGHQLTKRAAEIARDTKYPVKKFNDSLMADSSDVFRIVDTLSFMHLENNSEGHKFLTCINRKNRGCKDTPERDKFFAYPFTEFGIEDDLYGIPQYVTDIDLYGAPQGANDENIVEAAMF